MDESNKSDIDELHKIITEKRIIEVPIYETETVPSGYGSNDWLVDVQVLVGHEKKEVFRFTKSKRKVSVKEYKRDYKTIDKLDFDSDRLKKIEDIKQCIKELRQEKIRALGSILLNIFLVLTSWIWFPIFFVLFGIFGVVTIVFCLLRAYVKMITSAVSKK